MSFWRRRISNHWRRRRERRDGAVAATVLVDLLLGRRGPLVAATAAP
jgi:hypothetical protein